MNRRLLDTDVQEFIAQNRATDITRIVLQKSPFRDVSPAELATQIDGKKRSEKKLPLWFATPGIYFPPKLNLEQASSELTALYKSSLVVGTSLVDLTGGFGIDSFYFSRKVKRILHLEQNGELSAIAEHNLKILGAENVQFIVGDSIKWLQENNASFDTIYLDPARRVESKKVFLLKDTEPDVPANLDLLQSRAKRILLKTSPLFDIRSGLRELKNVKEVHVVSVKNDCKEIIWVIDKGFEGEPEIIASALGEEGVGTFTFKLSEESTTTIDAYANPSTYLYEPDVALLKAGAFKTISQKFGLKKLNVNTHLYTASAYQPGFTGRIFSVKSVADYRNISQSGVKKANIISRNFPLSPEEIKKKHKIQDGGDAYLIFCRGARDELLVVEAERLN